MIRARSSGANDCPSRYSWGQYKPQALSVHTAAVKFGSPHAFFPLQSVIVPICLPTGFIFGD